MNAAVVYSSASGNTERVAKAVADKLAAEGVVLAYRGCVPQAGSAEEAEAVSADVVFAGFWTDKGTCAEDMAALLAKLDGKRVFLFGTAGFGGSEQYFEQIAARVSQNLPATAKLLGSAMCQGQMGPGVKARYEAMLAQDPSNARIKAMIENFGQALGHPDEDDCERVASAAVAALRG